VDHEKSVSDDETPQSEPSTPATPPTAEPDGGSTTGSDLSEQIIDKLRTVHDPEIPVDIYELGLIYDVDIQSSGNVQIRMTLTSPACPAAQILPDQVRAAASSVQGVNDVEVNVVFDPPWSPDKMSEEARLLLGMM
jgi:FeS assembly SUF system protein